MVNLKGLVSSVKAPDMSKIVPEKLNDSLNPDTGGIVGKTKDLSFCAKAMHRAFQVFTFLLPPSEKEDPNRKLLEEIKVSAKESSSNTKALVDFLPKLTEAFKANMVNPSGKSRVADKDKAEHEIVSNDNGTHSPVSQDEFEKLPMDVKFNFLIDDILTDKLWSSESGDTFVSLLEDMLGRPIVVKSADEDGNLVNHTPKSSEELGNAITLFYDAKREHYQIIENPEATTVDDMQIKDVKADGNCIFRCIAEALGREGGEQAYMDIRTELASHVFEKGQDNEALKSFLNVIYP